MRLILHSPSANVALAVGIVGTIEGHEVSIAQEPWRFLKELGKDPTAVGIFFQGDWISAVELAHEVRAHEYQNLLFAVVGMENFDAPRTASALAKVLNAGADDAQRWPLGPEEIAARLDAISRRIRAWDKLLSLPGGAVFDTNNQTVSTGEISIHLTGLETRLLEVLASRQSTCISKDLCMSALYRGRDEAKPKIVDVYVFKLRKKLRPIFGDIDPIETVWGQGYRLAEVVA